MDIQGKDNLSFNRTGSALGLITVIKVVARAAKAKALLDRCGKTPQEAAGDYLRQPIRQVEQLIARRLVVAIGGASSLQFVLTVPTIWPNKAKHATVQALVGDGAKPLDVSLVTQAEPAALYSLRTSSPA
ncbi:hypothetical protein BJY01DRAFT_245618 [Aspergillus pseudoustus]|uniref:Uncharacterized protein n=1 Tax=Aspergillus pseudoustus TaxID=1810923 RepID=A0ABR4KEA0_9EURO